MIDNYKELFKTCTGSHVWQMNRIDSDKDIFKCYMAPSSDFLIGRSHRSSHFSQVGNIDTTSTEIGVVVEQLLKNNVNYFVNVMSPIVLYDGKELQELKILTQKNLSRQCFDSIYGLSYGNYKKYILTDKQNTEKKRKIIARTLSFGINLLLHHEFVFEPTLEDITTEDLESMMDYLKHLHDKSALPKTPLYKDEMYKWLLNLRIQKLKEEVDINDKI